MPLSEEELRLLEQMERALAAEDPRFVSALEGRNLVRAARLRIVLAVIACMAGAVAVGVGMWQRMTWVGILGFVVMVVTASIALAQWRSHRFVTRLGVPEQNESDAEFHGLRVIDGGRSSRSRRTPSYAKASRSQHPSMGGGSPLSRRYNAWLSQLEARWLNRRDRNL
ncbi:MAG TPA: DUF3040 domain-containing protein [Marmoricola sp.]|nr:DUF3040 domain-containing protein [Marmoricola sp.]